MITGKLIGNRDAILQGTANILSQSSQVLSPIMPDTQDYWYPHSGSRIHRINGKLIGNGDAILQGLANTLS